MRHNLNPCMEPEGISMPGVQRSTRTYTQGLDFGHCCTSSWCITFRQGRPQVQCAPPPAEC